MIEAIAIKQGERDDEIGVTMRGNAADIIKVLVHGLPYEAVLQLNEAIARELEVRKGSKTEK